MAKFLAATLGLALLAAPAFAEDAALPAGAYEVHYKLELPHIEANDDAVATVCLADAGGSQGFPVLSTNNPLSRCPVGKLRREGREFSFEIACPGGNAAKAYALFDLKPEGFEGRIAMNMGGKNMTMTEVQRGKRIGDCPAKAEPATH